MGKITSISSACAPKAGSTHSNQHNSRIWSLTQVGAGVVGHEQRILSGIFDRATDEHGNYRGETPYAVVGEIQVYPAVSALLKSVEWRPAVTVDARTGLLYRKLPSPNGFANSWLSSAEIAVQAWVGHWGKITSDRNAGIYRFEALNLPGRALPTFPDVDDLIDELLAEFVIDRLDHPVLERLLNPPATTTAENAVPVTPAQEHDDEIY